jgi:hypothetical protein
MLPGCFGNVKIKRFTKPKKSTMDGGFRAQSIAMGIGEADRASRDGGTWLPEGIAAM